MADDPEAGYIEFVWSHPGLRGDTFSSPPSELRLRVSGEVTLDELVEAFETFAVAAGFSAPEVKRILGGDE